MALFSTSRRSLAHFGALKALFGAFCVFCAICRLSTLTHFLALISAPWRFWCVYGAILQALDFHELLQTDDLSTSCHLIPFLILKYFLQIVLQPHRSARDLFGNSDQMDGLVQFGQDVAPICMLPQSDYPLHKLTEYHCEIAGWGMTEYNNSNSYPDSVRAARITVGDVSDTFCNYLYK